MDDEEKWVPDSPSGRPAPRSRRRRPQRGDAGQPEAVVGHVPPILRLSPHVPDAQLAEGLPSASGPTISTTSSRARDGITAVEIAEDQAGLGAVPVLQNAAEQEGVGTAGGRLEEATIGGATPAQGRDCWIGPRHRRHHADSPCS